MKAQLCDPSQEATGAKMRSYFLLLALADICVSGLGGPVSAEPSMKAAESLPNRRPGLWRISTLSPSIGLQVNEACIAPSDSIIGEDEAGCVAPQIMRADGQVVVVTIVCRAGERRVTRSLLFTGDFDSWYRVQGKVTSTGEDRTAEIHSGFTIDAKFMRPDCEQSN